MNRVLSALIVDRAATSTIALVSVLQDKGWFCTIVPDAPAALALLRQVRPAAVLVRVRRTGDDYDALGSLREYRWLDGIPLVALVEDADPTTLAPPADLAIPLSLDPSDVACHLLMLVNRATADVVASD